jgi:hypothetical protein
MQYVAHSYNCSLRIFLVITLADYSSFVSNDQLCTSHLSSAFIEKLAIEISGTKINIV